MSNHQLQNAFILFIAGFGFLLIMTIFFSIGEPTGKATDTSTTVFILNSSGANCSFDVQAGYNIISLPCLSTAAPIEEITNNTQVWAMYQYTPGQTDLWAVYNPNLPSYVVSDLQFMTRRAGYVTIMNASANITHEGLNVSQTGVPLLTGWNLVGYPSFVAKNATTEFSSLTLTEAVTYDRTSATFITYSSGAIVYVIPGLGYWINSTAGQTWTVTSS